MHEKLKTYKKSTWFTLEPKGSIRHEWIYYGSNNCVIYNSYKIAVFTYHSPHICFPWRRPCDYHAICCIDGKTIQCLPNPSHHVPIYQQQFPSYSNRKCKKSPFSRTAAHIFVSPGDASAIITQYVACIERQFNACQTTVSFRVIWCLSQCVSLKNR